MLSPVVGLLEASSFFLIASDFWMSCRVSSLSVSLRSSVLKVPVVEEMNQKSETRPMIGQFFFQFFIVVFLFGPMFT